MLFLLSVPTVLAGVRFGLARAFGALAVSLILSGCAGLVTPIVDTLYLKTALAICLLAWAAWIQFAPKSWSSFMDALRENLLGRGLVIVLLCTAVPFGNLEWAARLTG